MVIGFSANSMAQSDLNRQFLSCAGLFVNMNIALEKRIPSEAAQYKKAALPLIGLARGELGDAKAKEILDSEVAKTRALLTAQDNGASMKKRIDQCINLMVKNNIRPYD